MGEFGEVQGDGAFASGDIEGNLAGILITSYIEFGFAKECRESGEVKLPYSEC